jgi:hypothetical protein
MLPTLIDEHAHLLLRGITCRHSHGWSTASEYDTPYFGCRTWSRFPRKCGLEKNGGNFSPNLSEYDTPDKESRKSAHIAYSTRQTVQLYRQASAGTEREKASLDGASGPYAATHRHQSSATKKVSRSSSPVGVPYVISPAGALCAYMRLVMG